MRCVKVTMKDTGAPVVINLDRLIMMQAIPQNQGGVTGTTLTIASFPFQLIVAESPEAIITAANSTLN